MALEAKQLSISALFHDDLQFQIPNYQRPYSWDFENAFQLVEDLLSAWKRDDESYFLGSVVIVRSSEDGRTADVIDGQQRLTTLSILLAALRHRFIEDEESKAAILDLLRIKKNSIMGFEPRARIRLRDRDHDFFDQHIVGGDITGLLETSNAERDTSAKTNIKQNCEAVLESLDDGLDPAKTLDFLQFLMTKVFIVLVITDDLSSAHRIFGVLNTRGVPLQAADILKARVLGEVPESARDQYGEQWDDQIAKVQADPDRFFHHLLVCLTRNPTKRSLVDEFDLALQRTEADRQGGEFIDNVLTPYASAYQMLTGPDRGGLDRPRAEVLALLRQYQSDDWKPVAMWVLVNLPSTDLQLRVLKALERLFGVITVSKEGSDTRVSRMVEVLRKLNDALDDGIEIVPAEVIRIGDTLRHKAMLSLKSELPKTAATRKLALVRAHLQLAGKEAAFPRSFSAVSVFASEQIAGLSADIDPEFWRSRLGGLVLVQGNSKNLGKFKSAQKIEDFVSANALRSASAASHIGSLTELDRHQLQQRQDALAAAIASFWDITHDSEGLDLTLLDESKLMHLVGGVKSSRSSRVRLVDVLNVGIVSAGDVFVWQRPHKAEIFKITVTAAGTFLLEDGREVHSPSTAVLELTGSRAQALDVWVRESDGRKLREMWESYERRFVA